MGAAQCRDRLPASGHHQNDAGAALPHVPGNCGGGQELGSDRLGDRADEVLIRHVDQRRALDVLVRGGVEGDVDAAGALGHGGGVAWLLSLRDHPTPPTRATLVTTPEPRTASPAAMPGTLPWRPPCWRARRGGLAVFLASDWAIDRDGSQPHGESNWAWWAVLHRPVRVPFQPGRRGKTRPRRLIELSHQIRDVCRTRPRTQRREALPATAGRPFPRRAESRRSGNTGHVPQPVPPLRQHDVGLPLRSVADLDGVLQ